MQFIKLEHLSVSCARVLSLRRAPPDSVAPCCFCDSRLYDMLAFAARVYYTQFIAPAEGPLEELIIVALYHADVEWQMCTCPCGIPVRINTQAHLISVLVCVEVSTEDTFRGASA